MALQDILGIGKILPIDKLIDVMSSSVGRISKSYFDKKDSETKAYEIKKIAEARAEEMKIMSKAIKENHLLTGGIKYSDEKLSIKSLDNKQTDLSLNEEIKERTKNRIEYQETKKQLNLESITSVAAENLINEEAITDEPIDEDWKTRFFNIAQEISNEEMQELWGRILAGEIKQPKSYSLRTLELLKNLSKDEAEIFTKLAEYKFVSGNKYLIYNKNKYVENKLNISFTDKLLMVELGLIVGTENLQYIFNPSGSNNQTQLIEYGKKGIVFYRKPQSPKKTLDVIAFTKTGAELSKLIEQSYNVEYIELICSHFKEEKSKIEYGDLIKFPNNRFRLFNNVQYQK
jgi:uncharacterized repeat protein (TIGR03899 family)